MKTLSKLVPAALTALLCFACSEAGVDAKEALGNATKNLDLSNLSPEAMTSKVKELAGGLTEKLSGITDLASAEKAKEAVAPTLDKLAELKGALGDNMPNLDSLKGVVDNLKAKFAEGSDVRNLLAPLLEKIQSLVA